MKEKLQQYALFAEIISAAAIVASLIFVGLQVADSNRESRAATSQAAADSEMNMIATLLGHTDTWIKVLGVESDESTEEFIETREIILLMNLLMTLNENRYYQYQLGYLKAMPGIVSGESPTTFPYYNQWRVSDGATSRSPEFLELIDNLYAEE